MQDGGCKLESSSCQLRSRVFSLPIDQRRSFPKLKNNIRIATALQIDLYTQERTFQHGVSRVRKHNSPWSSSARAVTINTSTNPKTNKNKARDISFDQGTTSLSPHTTHTTRIQINQVHTLTHTWVIFLHLTCQIFDVLTCVQTRHTVWCFVFSHSSFQFNAVKLQQLLFNSKRCVRLLKSQALECAVYWCTFNVFQRQCCVYFVFVTVTSLNKLMRNFLPGFVSMMFLIQGLQS